MYVYMYIFLSFHTRMSKPLGCKAACKQEMKAKQSLYYTYALVNFGLKSKTECWLATDFKSGCPSGLLWCSATEKTVGLSGSQGMRTL